MTRILIHLLGFKTKDVSNLRKFAELNNITLERLSDRFFMLSFKDVPIDKEWDLLRTLVTPGDLNFMFNVISVFLGVKKNLIRPNNFNSLISGYSFDKLSEMINVIAKRPATLAVSVMKGAMSSMRIHNIIRLISKQQTKHTQLL